MKTQKLIALVGAGVVLACYIMIYLMLDDNVLPQQDGKPDVEYKKLAHSLNRLAILEDDLDQHHKGMTAEKTGVCALNFKRIPEVDIQMLDTYKRLKFDNPNGGVWTQGWNVQYDENQWNSSRTLQVFVVPHSHNDPGWLSTFEDYYTYSTKYILNNLVSKLSEDRRKKFIWAEILFFKLWWDEQSDHTRNVVKQLVRNGQLEFVAGGYVMPDESVSHWMAQLTQLTEGHQWLKSNLDFVPKTGWAIDPFGLSPTMPYLLKKSGLDNIVIQRVHYAVKKKLALDKHLEFRWRQLWDNDGSSEIFTHMMPFASYAIPYSCGPDPKVCCQFDFHRPPGYCFWFSRKADPITESNVEERATTLLDQYRKKAQLFKSNVLLIPLGDDFRFADEKEWDAQFENYQKLFDYMKANRRMNVQIQFGTLSDYFKALQSQPSTSGYPSLSGDFFTYSDKDDNYWSGYYTSRPFHKRLDRVLLASLRSSEVLSTIVWMSGSKQVVESDRMSNRLDAARRWHSLFQHHDGVTGTAKDHVVVDYARKMITALDYTAHILQQSVVHLLQKAPVDLDATYLSLDETRSHHTSPGDKYVILLKDDVETRKVVFYNPLPRSRTKVASIHVSLPNVRVTDENGRAVQCQISPVWQSSLIISESRYELSFVVTVPAFGLTTYRVVHHLHGPTEGVHLANVVVYSKSHTLSPTAGFIRVRTYSSPQEFSIGQRSELTARFGKTGLLKALRVNNTTFPVRLEFVKYGTRGLFRDKSGAYLFLPDKPKPDPVFTGGDVTVRLITGPILSRVLTDLPYVKHICTLYNSTGSDGLGLHITNQVDITETENFELAMRINTDIASGEVFFTDLNGLNIIKRQKFSKIPTQGNYYPLAAAGYIEDNRARMTVLTGQPLGAASMSSGQFEIMQDRRLMQGDSRGLGQGVTDNLLTYHQFTLLVEKRQETCVHSTPATEHPAGLLSLAGHLALDDLLHPLIALHPRSMPQLELNLTFSPVSVDLPVDLSIVSLRVVPIPNKEDKGVAVVLHRQALSLCWGHSELQRSFPVSKDGQIDLSKLLINNMKNWTVSDAPLTLTSVGSLRKSPVVNLCPHELMALMFYKTET